MSATTRFVVETWGQLVRWLHHMVRQPFHMAFSLLQPIVFLLLFGGMFSGVLGDELPGENYRSFILPGIVALTVFSNSMFGGVALLFDRETGFLQRLLAAPVTRSSILVARFLFTNLLSAIQTLIMVGAAVLLGARIATGLTGVGVLLVLGLLLGFGITMASLVLAFKLRGHADYFALLSVITLPLIFLSNAFVPLGSLPRWMQFASYLNPLTYAVKGMRGAVVTGIDPRELLIMAGALVVFDVLMLLWGSRVLRRELA